MADLLRKGARTPPRPPEGTTPELPAAVPLATPQPASFVPVATTPNPPTGAALHAAKTATQLPQVPPSDPSEGERTSLKLPSQQPVRALGSKPPAPTIRAEQVPSVPPQAILADGSDRPKVWVATHKAPAEPDPRLILVREPDSVRAACFRVMRHRLAERGNPRVIAVSSAQAGDGKTTCAANLALALSEFGRAKVLLLEANLRTPQLAVLFGFMPPECFTVQLQRHRERPLDPWSIVEAFSPSLHVLAVKPGEANRPLLDAPAFAIAVEMLLRVGYDYIVVDTPPVLGSADVNLVEDYVDAVVLAARSGNTRGRALRSAVEQLSPRKLFGVTLLDA